MIGFNILAKCPFRAAGLSSSVEVLPCMRSMQGNSPLNAGWVHSADGEGPPERELASVLSRLMPEPPGWRRSAIRVATGLDVPGDDTPQLKDAALLGDRLAQLGEAY